jgi:hypothetical protein
MNGLRANFEELKMLATDIEPVAICLQETNQKPGQDIILGGSGFPPVRIWYGQSVY